MLSIEDLLNPLPIAQHALEPDSPTSSFANYRVTPDFDTTARNSLMAEVPSAFNADPSSIQARTRSHSSLSTCRPHTILHHARSPSPAGDSSTSSPSRSSSPLPIPRPTIQHDVFLNRKTTLNTLYHYPLGAVVEYPETSSKGSIGHLFEISPDNWSNPRTNFVYSQGEPSGRTKSGSSIRCVLLTDIDGKEVPFREVHSTCMYK